MFQDFLDGMVFGKREMTRAEMEILGFKDYRYWGNMPYHNVILCPVMVLLFNQCVLLFNNELSMQTFTNENKPKSILERNVYNL